jgi:hypothetical protein
MRILDIRDPAKGTESFFMVDLKRADFPVDNSLAQKSNFPSILQSFTNGTPLPPPPVDQSRYNASACVVRNKACKAGTVFVAGPVAIPGANDFLLAFTLLSEPVQKELRCQDVDALIKHFWPITSMRG